MEPKLKRRIAQASFAAVLCGWLVLGVAARCFAQGLMRNDFEVPVTSWRVTQADARYRVDVHEWQPQSSRRGNGCEFIQLHSGHGTRVLLNHEISQAPIIAELTPSVWVRSDREGIQLLARVVLPRTLDPTTGLPVTTTLSGTVYSEVGNWQQLRLEQTQKQLLREVRVLRQRYAHADIHEAYIDRLMINAYGGEGRTRLWIDELELNGFVRRAGSTQDGVQLVSGESDAAAGIVSHKPVEKVQLSGMDLIVGGRPMFPLAIEYRGEPLSFLKERGFNTVWMREMPSDAVLEEAAQCGVWLVCPPPRPAGLDDPQAASTVLAEISPRFDCVLAWYMGDRLAAEQLSVTKRWIDQVRRADRRRNRPIMADPDAELAAYTRAHVDILLTHRNPIGTSCELSDYATWVHERPLLAALGTPMWTTVQTQFAPALCEQWKLLNPDAETLNMLQSDQMSLLVHAALASSARGLFFSSETRLDADDSATRQRLLALELLTLELDVVAPWVAGGVFAGTVKASDPEVRAALLQTDRARLLLPMWTGRGAQFVAKQSAGNGINFTVPGVPEEYDVFEITPAGLRPLRHKRAAGGTFVSLDEFGLTSWLVFSQDPIVLASLTNRLRQNGPRAARLQRDLAVFKYQNVRDVDRRLTSSGHGLADSSTRLSAAQTALQTTDSHISAERYQDAYLEARRAMRPLRQLERVYWEQAVAGSPSPMGSPAAVSFSTLPEHWALAAQLKSMPRPVNQLAEGNVEDLATMLKAGWRHFQHPQPGVKTNADLSAQGPRRGRFSLRLTAQPDTQEAPPGLIESPPLWIVTPPVPVKVGQLVRMHGWVRVTAPISGSVDGLMILDSMAGEALAERIGESPEWREFTLYRVAPRDGEMTLTFALTGMGSASIDDVSIETFSTNATSPATNDRPATPRLGPAASNPRYLPPRNSAPLRGSRAGRY